MWTWTRTIFVLRTSICFWTIRSLQIIMKFHFAFSFSISAKSLSGDVVDRLKVEHEYEYRRKFLCFLFDASLSPWWNDMQLLRRTVRGLARVWECEFDAVPRSNSRGRSVGMWFLATRGETPPSAVRFARDVWTRRFLAVFFSFLLPLIAILAPHEIIHCEKSWIAITIQSKKGIIAPSSFTGSWQIKIPGVPEENMCVFRVWNEIQGIIVSFFD